MMKKGQGAMEYLMTYGWAILVVVIVGVVLWQMGIFNPSGSIAAGSDGFGTIKPAEWACDAVTGDLSLAVINGGGQKITGLQAEGADCTATAVSAGDTATCTITDAEGCLNVDAGDRFESTVTLSYTSNATGLVRQSTGKVWGAAE
jgi:hypothetical protein